MNRKLITSSTLGAAGLLATALALTGGSSVGLTASADAMIDPFANLPPSLSLTGVVRDFRERSASGGHTDFERQPTRGFGHYAGMCADQLDADGKPAFNHRGRKVTTQWKDAAGRVMMPPRPHVASRSGDRTGVMETSDGGACTDAASYAMWWRDTPNVSMSAPLAITLNRQPNTNVYTFNDRTDPLYMNRGGFFPINGELLGNSGGSTPNQNFHFSYEIDATFMYQRGTGQVFTFIGDDDVYVFVDGKCVIDIGGVHSAVSQTIDLDRCEWLESGRRYSLKFFFAERHRTQSNFRIDTTLNLENAELPQTAGLYD